MNCVYFTKKLGGLNEKYIFWINYGYKRLNNISWLWRRGENERILRNSYRRGENESCRMQKIGEIQ